MTPRRLDPRDDAGTILVLVLGFFAVLLVMVAVVVNVSAVILAKRGVASAADGAAVSAAQSLSLDAFYARGLASGFLPLDQRQAAAAVATYEVQARSGQPGLELAVDISNDRTTAIVRGRRIVQLPFGRLLGFRPVRVEAEARARAPTAP